MEQHIAPVYIDLITGLIAKKAERVQRVQKNVTGRSLSITLVHDPLNDDGRGCDTAVCGAGRTTRESRNNGSGHMISLSITDSHSSADEMQTSSTMQRW